MRRASSPRSAHAGAPGTWIAIAVLCGLTGCGASTNAAVAPPVATRAGEYARAVNIGSGDVPEMSQSAPEAPAPAPTAEAAAFARCDGESSPTLRVAGIQSAELSAGRGPGGTIVRSVVEVLPSPAVAAGNLAAFQSAAGMRCYVRFLEAANKRRPGALRWGHTRISPLPDPLAGQAPSFARRVTNILHGAGAGGLPAQITVYHDTYAFVVGSAEVELLATGFTAPVPLPTEQRLLELLYSRATVHHL